MAESTPHIHAVVIPMDDGKLNCSRDANGRYSCTNVTPIKNMTGVCVDDQTNVGVTGRVEIIEAGEYNFVQFVFCKCIRTNFY